MTRLETILMAEALKALLKNKDYESMAEILDEVLKEAKTKKDGESWQ